MAATFSQIKAGLDAIAARIVTNRNRAKSARDTLATAVADLAALGTEYGQFVQDVDAALAEAPADPALINAKAEKDRLVAEFSALSTAVTTGRDAIVA